MIKIVSKKPKDVDFEWDIVACFDSYVLANDFGSLDLYALKEIDNATLIDRSADSVETPYGTTSIEYLSTGCKVVLYYLHKMRQGTLGDYFYATEAGVNALNVLFDCAERLGDEKTTFIVQHLNHISELKERDYTYDGIHMRRF